MAPAYTKPLPDMLQAPKCRGCMKLSTVEVFNNKNESQGYFCKFCGEYVVKRLNEKADEREASRRVRSS